MVQMFTLPSEYERAAAEARRRRRMAELLASQEYDPSTVQNAPIPAAAPLVQGLQAFIKGRLGRQAEEALEKAEAADVAEFENLYKSIRPQERASIGPDAFADPMEMASKYTAPRMETYTPSEEEKRTLLERTAFGRGSPSAKKYATALLAEMDKKPESKVMEFGGQLLNVSGGTATPVMMGGKAVTGVPETMTPYQQAQLELERDKLAFQKSRANQAAERPKPPAGWVYVDDTSTEMTYAKGGPFDPNRERDLPPNIVVLIANEGKNAGKFANTLKKTNDFIQSIESGQLPLNKLSGAEYATRRAFDVARGQEGDPTEPYVRYYELERFVNQQVNSILNLAKGPQTEGDALRARQQILDNPNNEKIVLSALKDLQRIWNEEIELSSSFIEDLKTPYGRASNRSNW